MNSKSVYYYFLILGFLLSCSDSEEISPTPPPLFSTPTVTEADPSAPYVYNQINGDTIRPVATFHESGYSINGEEIPAKGFVTNIDSMQKPLVFDIQPMQKWKKIDAHPNIVPLKGEPIVVSTSIDSLPSFDLTLFPDGPLDEIPPITDDHFLINNEGDTLPTNVRIPAKSKLDTLKFTPTLKNFNPRFRDNSSMDIQFLDANLGLPGNLMISLVQSKDGNIWIGTDGWGLLNFDGNNMQQISKHNMPSKSIHCLMEDSQGNIWAGTDGNGFFKFDGAHFEYFSCLDRFSGNLGRSALEDKKGNVWLGTWQSGISRYDGNNFIHFKDKENISSTMIMSSTEDEEGNIWFGTWKGGVTMYDGSSFKHLTSEQGLSSDLVLSTYIDSKGVLWIGTIDAGINRYDGKTITQYSTENGLAANAIWEFQEDRNGDLWMATGGGGICRFDGEVFTHVTETEGLRSNNVYDIIEERSSGKFWLASRGGGLSVYDPYSFVNYSMNNGFPSNAVECTIEDRNGNIWFATPAGVVVYDGKNFNILNEDVGLPANNIIYLNEDQKGNIWMVFNGSGVGKYNGERIEYYSTEQGLGHFNPTTIMNFDDDKIIIGLYGKGFDVFDGQTFTHYSDIDGFAQNIVLSSIVDKNGNAWFGTDLGGICKFDGNTFYNYNEGQGLSNGQIYALSEDSEGNIWIGTKSEGLDIFDGKTFTNISTSQGLVDNKVTNIIEDDHHNMWIGTSGGISVIVYDDTLTQEERGSKIDRSKYKTILQLKNADGINGFSMEPASGLLDSKNRLWMGSDLALNMQDLELFNYAKNPPQVFLRELSLNGNGVDFRNVPDSLESYLEFDGVENFQNYPLNLELPYHLNHITFEFYALDWAAPEKIQFSYVMKGFGKDWSQPSTDIKADFKNLPPGDYTFMLSAIGESGTWSQPLEYNFTIKSPWWETTWWYLVQALFFIGLLALTYFISKNGSGKFSSILATITVIIIIEALLLWVSSYIDRYSNGIPLVNLSGNVVLALLIKPVDRLAEKYFKGKKRK